MLRFKALPNTRIREPFTANHFVLRPGSISMQRTNLLVNPQIKNTSTFKHTRGSLKVLTITIKLTGQADSFVA